MIKKFPALLVLIFLVPSPTLTGQDLSKLRRQFQKAARKTSRSEQHRAILALAASASPAVQKDLAQALDAAEKALASLTKKIVKLGGQRKSIWKSVDRQASAGRPVYRGSAAGPRKKASALHRTLSPLYKRADRLEAWHQELVVGYGRLLEQLPKDAGSAALLSLVEKADHASKLGFKLRVISILKVTNLASAREALIETAAGAPAQEVRIAALDALGARGEPASATAVSAGLKDDAWAVQTSAALALRRIPSTRSIEALMESLGRVQGRVRDDVQQALEDLCGITFFDNQTLWQEWWKRNKKDLTATLKQLDAQGSGQHVAAVMAVGSTGFLAGAVKLLGALGLGPANPLRRAEAPAGLAQKIGPAGADELRVMTLESIAQAIGTRPKRIRDRAFLRLLWNPWKQERKFQRRLDYVGLFGPSHSRRVLQLLVRLVRPGDLTDKFTAKVYPTEQRRALRLTAIRALGHQISDRAARALGEVLEAADRAEAQAAALAALQSMHTRGAVETLVRSLSHEDKTLRGQIAKVLEKLTGESFGSDEDAWHTWWRGLAPDWKPRGAAVSAAQKVQGAGKGGTSFYGIETRSKHIIYIIDVSGSMNVTDAGKGGDSRIDVARRELIKSIHSLPADATFNIIFYNHEHSVWRKKMVLASKKYKKAATDWVTAKNAVGATNIFDPIEHAFRLAGRGTHDKRYGIVLDTIFFLSDGQPNRGRIIDTREILKEVRRMNALMKVKIHTVGIGSGHDAAFMRALADLTGGTYVGKQ